MLVLTFYFFLFEQENVPKEQLTEATVVCKSLEDVRLEEFGLPPFKS